MQFMAIELAWPASELCADGFLGAICI